MSAPRGVCSQGVSAPGGGVSAPGGGVSALGDDCSGGCLLPGDVYSQGVSSPGGCVVVISVKRASVKMSR